MTPHSERDEYTPTAMESNIPKAKPARVRPVVPLSFTKNRRNKSSTVVPVNHVSSVVESSAPDAAVASHDSVPSVQEESLTQTGQERVNDAPQASVTSLDQASHDLASTTTDSDAQPLAASAVTSLTESPQTESKPVNQEQEPRGDDQVGTSEQLDQAQLEVKSTSEEENSTMQPLRPNPGPMPPPGFHHVPHHGINGSVNGSGRAEQAVSPPIHGGFQNGVISPPPEALVNAPAFVPGHSHHMSSSGGTPITMVAPQSIFPPPGFENRPPMQMNGESASSSFDRAAAGLNIEPQATNGQSHPGSRAMSHSSRGLPDIISPQQETFRHHASMHSQEFSNGRHRNGSIPIPPLMAPPMPQPDMGFDAALLIRDYLLSQFGAQDFADYILQVFRADECLLSIPVHSLLVVRSPTLHNLVSALRYANDGSRFLRLEITDKIFVEQAFKEALQFVYGAAPLSPGFLNAVSRVPPFSTRDTKGDTAQFACQMLSHALSLISSGLNLQLEAVVFQSTDLAKRLIRWDTLNVVLPFVLVDGLPQGWRTQNSLNGVERLQGLALLGDGVKSELLRDIIDYLAVNFPHRFEFTTTVSQLEDCPRLPMVLDAKPSMSNPRLSRIRFGELPGELPAEQPDFITAQLSSILLSLPFEALKALSAHPALLARGKSFQLINIMEAVIAEREVRRNRVLESKRTSPREGPLLETAMWREEILRDQQAPSGVVIARQRVEK